MLNTSKNINILFIVSILLALTLRITFEINFPHIDGDYAHLALEAKNFIEGHGFTYGRVNARNISQVKYTPINYYPNGFCMMLVPLYYITGSFISSMVLIQVIGIILLIFGFIRIFKILEIDKLVQSIFLLFTAFILTPYSYLLTTDMLTGALFLWIIALTIEVVYTQEKRTLWKKIAIGGLLFLSAALRYACIINILIIPCFFVFYSILKREKKAFFTGILIFLCAFIPTLIFNTIYKMTSDRTEFISNLIHFRFYWNLLKWFDAFPLKAFFYTLPLEYKLPYNQVIIKLVRLFEYLLSIFILGYLLSYFLKKRDWLTGLKEKKPIDIFTTISIISFILIVGFISFQTITTPPEVLGYNPHWMPNIWTFVYCTRYFVIVIFLVQIFFFILMDTVRKKIVTLKYSLAFIMIIFALSMFVNIIFWGYTIYKYHIGNSSYSYWYQGRSMISAHKLITLDAEKNPGVNIVIASRLNYSNVNDPTIFSRATNFTFSYDSVIQGKFKYTKSVILYTLMPRTNLTEQEKKFVSGFNAKQVFQWDASILYPGGTLYRTFLH